MLEPRVGSQATLLCSLIGGIIFLACDADLFPPAPSTVCVESGAQCRLREGPLGVCERSRCPVGSTPPCFQCTSQH